jgi:tetratricopeptide (TPR) repeat protein
MTPTGFRSSISTRALQAPDPPNEVVGRVLNALRAERIADAVGLIHQLPKDAPLEQAWKDYLEARILIEQGDFVRAKTMAQQAASTSLRLGLSDPENPPALRLAAAALELEGAALRRQDQPVEASRIHLAALALRRDYGIPDEQGESAMSLASCAESTGDLAAAERWYRCAGNFEVADAGQARRKSSALIRLSTLLTKLSRHEEAMEAAQSAQKLMNEYMPGDVATISAGLHTAQATIRHAEKLLGEDSDRVCSLLDNTSILLRTTREDLSGFGLEADRDLAWCDEQFDFVERLRQTIRTAPNTEDRA